MIFGYDTDGERLFRCAFYTVPEKKMAAACLLHGFGTVPHRNMAEPQGIRKGLDLSMGQFLNTIEFTIYAEGCKDLRYVATHIVDEIQRVNSRLREAGAILGQGIYIGGAIVYFVENHYLLIPFGGAAVYIAGQNSLIHQAEKPSADGLIRDAIGGAGVWKGRCWQGILPYDSSMFLLSEDLKDTDHTFQKIEPALTSDAHPNTPSMLLRRSQMPQIGAVLEIRNR